MSLNDPSMLETFPSLIPSKNFKSWKGYVLINVSFQVLISVEFRFVIVN